MLKPRCKRCYTILRQREIAMSNELNLEYEMCSDCIANYIEDQFRKVDKCI